MKELSKKIIPIAIISFLIASILQLISLIPIILIPRVMDVYVPNQDIVHIVVSALIFCGTPVIATIGFNLYQYYLMLKSRQLVAEINLRCFDKLLHQPMAFFDENYSAELSQKASQDVVSFISLWTIDFPQLLSSMLMGIVVFVALFRINIYIACFQILYIPISLILMKLVGKRLEFLIENVMKFNAKQNQLMQESFHSIRMIKANMLEKECCKKVEAVQNNILKIWGKVAFFDNFVGGISNTLVPGVFYGGSFVIAAIMTAQGIISIGYMTSSLSYATKIHGLFKDLIRTYNDFKKAKGEVHIVESYLALADERCGKGNKKFEFSNTIELEEVFFRYPTMDKNVLENVTLTIQKGKWLAISGASGVGKSTILELLLRFYEADAGIIKIDGIPIDNIDVYDLRTHISYVPQVPVLMQGTIRDNLRLVRPEVTKEELDYVAEKTGIVTEIEGGLDKEVGEGGMLLSGGEKQRIAIARCILEQKSIWLLDEVTSQLDVATQDMMVKFLKEEHDKRHTTIISVAHRKGFNCYADQEYVL